MDSEKKYLLDDPGNIKLLLYALYAICAFLLVLDLVLNRHTIHDFETLFGFYGIYGFVSCVLLVLIAKWMRSFLIRPETYYDSEEPKGTEREFNVDP